MVLTLYKTDIRPEMNAVIEDFDKYMTDEYRIVHQWQNVKYTQPEIDIMLKLPLDGHYNSLGEFDYAILYDPDTKRDYYYFVVSFKWKAKTTLQLQLSMDTLNTFWAEIKTGLTDNSHVTRRYFDRWIRYPDSSYLTPIVDNHPEDITQPSMLRVGSPKTMGESDHWTIVYLTEYDKTETLGENPTVCLALPETEKPMVGETSRDLRWDSFPNKTMCVLDYAHAPNATISWSGGSYTLDSSSSKVVFVFSNSAKTIALRQYRMGEGWVITSIPGTATVNGTSVIYRQPSNFEMDIDAKFWQFDDPVNFAGSFLPAFSDWFATRKTDQRLIKIMELPYAPFKVGYTDNRMNVPNGWQMRPDGALMLVDPTPNFVSLVSESDNPMPESSLTVSAPGVGERADPLKYETKLLNSAYRTVKYIYDGNAHAIAPENYSFQSDERPSYSCKIYFQSSTGMDNSLMFEFRSAEKPTADYGEYLVCNRTTEVPYYNSAYLDYIRYGKAIDERNYGWKTASTVVSGIGSTVQTAASLAFAVKGAEIGSIGGGLGAIIGAGVGLLSAAIATTYSAISGRDQLNSKIDQYTHQASTVSVANDLSLFRKYGKNKLLKVEYEPAPELKLAIGRYFERYGYSCDEYGVVNWHTRHWSDYFVIDPQFDSGFVFGDYEADIAARMKAGFRIMHRNEDQSVSAKYDWLLEFENVEENII